MSYKDAVKYGIVGAITLYVIDVSIRVTRGCIEHHRFVNDNEYRESLRKNNIGKYWRLKQKYDS